MSVAFPPSRPLSPGSRIAIVAPSGPFARDRFEQGVKILEQRYEVSFDAGIFDRKGYFAGSDERRLSELAKAIRDPAIDAIVCARGGYGATRLLPDLDPSEVADANKLLIGFSDVTALHVLWARAGVRSLHGPMVASLAVAGEETIENWFQWVEGRQRIADWSLDPMVPGFARGRLLGGNLAVLASLVGTPYAPPLEEVILFLEDVGERPYRVDRVLTTLGQAGWLERCAGFVIGAFTEGDPGPDGVSTEEVIHERLGNLGVPVLRGFPAGHIDENQPLPFGVAARIEDGRLFLEP